MKKCSLQENINKCGHFDRKNKGCNNPEKCSFQENDNETAINQQKYMREERWYEKYHKGTRRI